MANDLDSKSLVEETITEISVENTRDNSKERGEAKDGDVLSRLNTPSPVGSTKKKSKDGRKTRTTKTGGENEEKAKSSSKVPDILDKAAMENALNICHNVQDLLYFRGFYWEGASKKGKGKARKKGNKK